MLSPAPEQWLIIREPEGNCYCLPESQHIAPFRPGTRKVCWNVEDANLLGLGHATAPVGLASPASAPFMTLPQLLSQVPAALDSKAALLHKYNNIDGSWESCTWREMKTASFQLMNTLRPYNLEKASVLHLYPTQTQVLHSIAYAVTALGAVLVGVEPTEPSASIQERCNLVVPKVVFAQHMDHVDKHLDMLNMLDYVEIIVVESLDGGNRDHQRNRKLWGLQEFLSSVSRAEYDGDFVDPESVAANNIAAITFTSGTTGRPKAVMFTHDNLISAARSWHAGFPARVHDGTSREDLQMSEPTVLTLAMSMPSHITFWVFDAILPVIFAIEGNAKVNSVLSLAPNANKTNALSQLELMYKVKPSWIFNSSSRWFDIRSLCPPYLDAKDCKHILGLDHCGWFATGSAPMDQSTHEWYQSRQMELMDGVAPTEACAMGTRDQLNPNDACLHMRSYGHPMPGVQLRLLHIPGVDFPYSGEVQFCSRGNAAGYLQNKEASQDLMDGEGWLSTGDVATMREDGKIVMLGRQSDKLILADGSFFWAAQAESCIQHFLENDSSSHGIYQIMLAGNGQEHPVVLITFKKRDDRGSIATGVRDCVATTIDQANHSPALQQFVLAKLDLACKRLRRDGEINKFVVVEEFTARNGGITERGSKLRRDAIEKRYVREIAGNIPIEAMPEPTEHADEVEPPRRRQRIDGNDYTWEHHPSKYAVDGFGATTFNLDEDNATPRIRTVEEAKRECERMGYAGFSYDLTAQRMIRLKTVDDSRRFVGGHGARFDVYVCRKDEAML